VSQACMAMVLVNPLRPQEAGSYLWCRSDSDHERVHLCYSGVYWSAPTDQLVEPTPEMRVWRTGDAESVRSVNGRLLG
jgi:hypothetical protein